MNCNQSRDLKISVLEFKSIDNFTFNYEAKIIEIYTINRLELLFRIIYERKMLMKNKQISTTKKKRIKREREKRRHFKVERRSG